MSSSPSQRKKNLRDKKIAVAVFHYVHHTHDLASIADTINVNEQTLAEWQKTQEWHNELAYWQSKNHALCDSLALDQMPDTQHGEVNGSLTNFAWIWGNIFQDGIEIDEIGNRKRIGGFRMNSEQKCRMKQIGIENVFQRIFRLARIGYRNVRTLISVLF